MSERLSKAAACAAVCALAGLGSREAGAQILNNLTFTNQVVDSTPNQNPGIESSLAIDGNGRPHIAYLEIIGGDLKYAHKNASGTWIVETVDSTGISGFGVSLALDASGMANIFYFRAADTVSMGDLVHAKRSCVFGDFICSWTITTVAVGVQSPSLVGNTAITVDHAGNVQGMFVDDAHGELKYVRHDSAGWSLLSVTPDPSGTVSIAVDASNLPRVAFSNGNVTQRYAQVTCIFILCGWTIEDIDSGGGGVVRLDGSGRVSVGYLNGVDVRFAQRSCDSSGSNCSWSHELVFAGAGPSAGPSLAVGPAGAAHMSFYATAQTDLRYARRGRFGWSVERADLFGSLFGTTSIALDASGNPNISYFDHFNDDLRFAHGAPLVLTTP